MARLSRLFSSARARVVGGVLATMLLLVGAVGVSANVNVQSDSQRATSWVATHQGALPQTLEEFAAYPIAYQHAIFDALPAADKSRFWRDQLTRLLARPNLTGAQQAFIQDAIAKATPESFGPLADHPEICESIVKIFPDKSTKQVFSHLGILAKPAFSVRASLVTLTEAVRVNDRHERQRRHAGLQLPRCGLVRVRFVLGLRLHNL